VIDRQEGIGDALEEVLEALVEAAQLGLRRLRLGDVGHHPAQVALGPGHRVDRVVAREDVARAALRVRAHGLVLHVLAGQRAVVVRAHELLELLVTDHFVAPEAHHGIRFGAVHLRVGPIDQGVAVVCIADREQLAAVLDQRPVVG
jgi:hypothetical protein